MSVKALLMTGECLSERLGCLSETLNNLEWAVRHLQYLHAGNVKVISVFFMIVFKAQQLRCVRVRARACVHMCRFNCEHTLHTGDQQVLEEPSQARHSGHEPA